MKKANESPFAKGEVTKVEVYERIAKKGGEKVNQAQTSAMASEIALFLGGTKKQRNGLVEAIGDFSIETLKPMWAFFGACHMLKHQGYAVRYDIKPIRMKKNCKTVTILKHGKL